MGFLLGGFIPNCYAQTFVEIAKLEIQMFRPPPDYKWKQRVLAYETLFNAKTPQWVLTLGLNDAEQLLSTCIRLKFKLTSEVLIAGEALIGFGGLWAPSRNRWDLIAKEPSKPNFSK